MVIQNWAIYWLNVDQGEVSEAYHQRSRVAAGRAPGTIVLSQAVLY